MNTSPSHQNHALSSTPNSGELDLRQLFGILLDHKWLIAVVTGVFLVLSCAYAILATPIYKASAMVQVEKKLPSLPGLSELTNLVGDGNTQAVTEIALLNSQMVLGKVVDELGLDVEVTPQRFPIFGDFIARHFVAPTPRAVAAPWLGMSRYDWGGSVLEVQQFDVPSYLLGQPLTLIAVPNDRFQLLDNDGQLLLSGAVGQALESHGVKLQVESLRANPGMRFVLCSHLRQGTIKALQAKLTVNEQGKDSGILMVDYPGRDPLKTAAVLDAIVQQYVRQNVDRASEQAASRLQFVKEQLPSVRRDLERAEQSLADYQSHQRTADISLQTKGLLDQIVAVETQLSQLKLRQAEVERLYTPQHPAYRTLLQQIGELQGKQRQLEGQVAQLPDTQQALLKRTRDVKVGSETYSALLTQAQQLDIARAGTIGNARVVDRSAVDTSAPVAPKKTLVVIGGTLLGMFLAIGFVVLRQQLNRGIEDPSEIEAMGLSVYATIPYSIIESGQRLMAGMRRESRLHRHRCLLAQSAPNDLAIEAIRSLRTNLHFAALEAKNNILMISSASPAAGKTFVSANLGFVVAQAGQRVLVIDADMRKGHLHRALGDVSGPGLSELLSEQVPLETALRESVQKNLYYIPRGKVPPNPSELLMCTNFGQLLEQLASGYDLVIVDTPPILAVTDAAIVGRYASITLLVARFGLNQAREVSLAWQRFEQSQIALRGVILNGVQRRSTGYYSYGYYQYQTTKDA